MAAQRKSRRRSADDDLDESLRDDLEAALEEGDRPLSRRRRRRRRWRLRLAVLLIVAVGMAAAAPLIIAKTPLRNVLLARAVDGTSASLAARDASFSWTGGQGLAGVTLADGQGRSIATVELVTLDRSLVGLLADSRRLGKAVVRRPVVHLETREGGSNLEDLARDLAEAARRTSPHDTGPVAIEVEIVDGVVHGVDALTGQAWRVDGLNAAARTGADGELLDLAASGVLTLVAGASDPTGSAAAGVASALSEPTAAPATHADGSGRFQLHLAPHTDQSPEDEAAQQLELIADRLPLAPLEPWLARMLPGARVTGSGSADLKLTWSRPAAAMDQKTGNADAVPGAADEQAGDGGAGSTPAALSSLRLSASGRLNAADLRFTARALEGDLLELPTAAVSIDAELNRGRLDARQLRAQCDWLRAEASGAFDLGSLAAGDWRRPPATEAAITASVDLPQLARMLPRTLRLRPGITIDSGNLELTARSMKAGADAATAHRWTVAASIDNLLGSDGRRAIRWTTPVEAGFEAAGTADGVQLRRAIFRSAFASATAEAVDEGYRGDVAFNLDQLAEQLGQFVDLSQWKLAGAGKGEFMLRNTGDDRFVAVAKLELDHIDVRTGERIVWLDPDLQLTLNANGRRRGLTPHRIDAASVLMRSRIDTFDVELAKPVDLAQDQRTWAVRVKGDGPLASWAGRLRPWVSGVPDELAGAATVTAELRVGPGLVDVARSKIEVRDLHTRIGDVEITEPRLEAGGDFRVSLADRAIDSKDYQLATSTVAARVGGLSLQLADAGPPTVRGHIAFRGDLERVAAWFGLTGASATIWPRGHAMGRVELASDASRAAAALTVTAEPFTLVRRPSPSAPQPPAAGAPSSAVAWHEPKLTVAANAVYAHAEDRLDLEDVRLNGQTIQLTGRGAVEKLRSAGLVRGDVDVTYDAAEFARLLAGYLGPGVKITGANAARLQVNGRLHEPASGASQGVYPPGPSSRFQPPTASLAPHWSRRWQVSAEAGWSAADLYGLPIGAARIAAQLREGQLEVAPLDLAVGQGRITAAPRARLDPPPHEIMLPPGPLISNVAISPEVSEAMLKYAAPVLASATRTEGSFSLFLDSGAQIPLGDPAGTRAAGRLTIHRLSILPGPMLQDVINLISRVEALSKRRPEGLLGALVQPPAARGGGVKGVTMNERTIDVQIVDGRVYHRNLEFFVDDVPVRTYGSVGFDQTLAIEIEIPVQAKWVGNERALQGLIGQVIRIPVSGTFTRWKIDERAIGDFLAKAAQSAVSGAIEGELGRALDELFKPRQ